MIILQSRLSGLYFKSFGLWVSRAADALRFGTVASARQFISGEHVSDVAVLDTPELDVLIPRSPARRESEVEGGLALKGQVV